MAEHNDLGKKGESMAAEYLLKKGWSIKEQNWRFGKDEIDLIIEKADTLSFVEVKTRYNDYFGEPHEFVSKSKQRRIIRAAEHYIDKYDVDHEVQFDIVSIILNQKKQTIEHIEDAFSAKW